MYSTPIFYEQYYKLYDIFVIVSELRMRGEV